MRMILTVALTMNYLGISCSASHFTGEGESKRQEIQDQQSSNSTTIDELPPDQINGDQIPEIIELPAPPNSEVISSDIQARQGDLMGYSVDISGDWLIAGAWGDDDAAADAGAAYFYHWETFGGVSTWVMKQKVTPSDCGGTQGAKAHFGKVVSISSQFAAVGAPHDNDDSSQVGDDFVNNIGNSLLETSQQSIGNAGNVFVYKWDQGTGFWNCFNSGIINNPAPIGSQDDDIFGISLDIYTDPNTNPATGLPVGGVEIIIGAKGDDSGQGRAYFFETDGINPFTLRGNITAPPGERQVDAFFAESVAISGNTAIVGAPLYDEIDNESVMPQAGAAYIYQKDSLGNWNFTNKLAPLIIQEDLHFGKSVDVGTSLGEIAIVGAYKDDANGLDSGAAYVYRKDNQQWVAETIAPPADVAVNDHFGFDVAISGNVAMVGSPGDDDMTLAPNTDSGSAYFYEYQNGAWQLTYKMGNPRAIDLGSQYSFSMALDGQRAAIGAPLDDDADINSGTVTFVNLGTPQTQP